MLTRISSSTASRVDLSPKGLCARSPKPQETCGEWRSRGDLDPEPGWHPSKLGSRFPFALSTQASTVERSAGFYVAASLFSLAQDAASPMPDLYYFSENLSVRL